MKKTCPTCNKHGVKLRNGGYWVGDYCPVCGTKCVPLNLPKIKVYIPIWFGAIVALGIALFGLFAYVLGPSLPVWRAEEAQRLAAKQVVIDSLDGEWEHVYNLVLSASKDYTTTCDVFEKRYFNDDGQVKSLLPILLRKDQIELILDDCPGSTLKEMVIKLMWSSPTFLEKMNGKP